MIKQFLLCVACGIIVMSCTPAHKADIPAIKQQLENKTNQFVLAFNKQDINGLTADYWNNPDLPVYFPDGDYRGFDAMKQSWQTFFQHFSVERFALTELHTDVDSGGEMAYQNGKFDLVMQMKSNGQEIKAPGRFTQVWKNMNGTWVIVVDHASSPLPPPPAIADTTRKM